MFKSTLFLIGFILVQTLAAPVVDWSLDDYENLLAAEDIDRARLDIEDEFTEAFDLAHELIGKKDGDFPGVDIQVDAIDVAEQQELMKRIEEEQRFQRLERERLERIAKQKRDVLEFFHLQSIKGDNNCYFRSIARSLPKFDFDQEKHAIVRQEVVDHILHVMDHPLHPLHQEYQFHLSKVLLEDTESLVNRLLKIGTVEGWGGLDITQFVANTYLADITKFNMMDGNEYTVKVDPRMVKDQPGERLAIYLWYEYNHYQALIPQ